MSLIGKNIRQIRTINGLNQSQFGEIFDLSRANIGSYEEGRAEPRIETILKFANYFSIDIDSLLTKELSPNDLLKFDVLQDSYHHSLSEDDPSISKNIDLEIINFSLIEHNHNTSILESVYTDHLSLPSTLFPDHDHPLLAIRIDSNHIEQKLSFSNYGNILILSEINLNDIKAVKNKIQFDGLVITDSHTLVGHLAITNQQIKYNSTFNSYKQSFEIENIKELWKVVLVISKENDNISNIELRLGALEQELMSKLKTKHSSKPIKQKGERKN